MSTPTDAGALVRVEKGHADPEELAVLTAVLAAVRAATARADTRHPHGRRRSTARWQSHAYRSPVSWHGTRTRDLG